MADQAFQLNAFQDDAFQVGKRDGQFLSEDYHFCHECRKEIEGSRRGSTR